jgi:hypothetical protein
MGFRPQRTIYHLTFEDVPELKGLEIRIQSCTIRELNEMASAGETATEDDNDAMTEMFVRKLVSWNIEDDAGQPVPISTEGVESQEPSLLAAVIMAWQKAMVAVPDPLRSDSLNGRSSEEASLGLANSSQNLQSFPRPS